MRTKVLGIVKEHYVLLILALGYCIFYANYSFGGYAINSGDALSLHYPSIHLLRETIIAGHFPFYTERIFSGFPLYENSEVAYLNILRIFLALIFSPITVLKIEHALFFFLGTLGWYLLTKRFNFSNLAIIVSHTIFFYSVQITARFAHINLIYIYFLLPICLYLYEKFLHDKKLKWVIILALVNSIGIFYGNFNGIVISGLAQIVYVLCSIRSYRELPSVIKMGFVLGIWILSFSMVTLLPSFMLFLTSQRNSGGLTYTEGSVHSIYILLNLLYPYPLGMGDKFVGAMIKNQWLIHEINIYPGLAAMITAMLGFFSVNNKKIKLFFYVNFNLLIILATLGYLPFNDMFNIPPINVFRYWIRYAIVFHLSLALLVGKWMSDPLINFSMLKKNFLKNTGLFGAALALLIIIYCVNREKATLVAVQNYLVSAFPHDFVFLKLSTGILIGTIVTLLAFINTKQKKLLYLLTALIIFDVTYFAHRAYQQNIIKGLTLVDSATRAASEKFPNTRIVYLNNEIKGNVPLYYPSWSLFGYAVSFEQKDYGDLMATYGMGSRRFKESKPDNLEDLGVTAVINADGSINNLHTEPLELIKARYSEGYYLNKRDGDISFEITTQEPQNVATLIRNFPGWKLKVNGQSQKFNKSGNSVYLTFFLNKGQNLVSLKYYPIHFFVSLPLSFVLILLSSLLTRRIFSTWFKVW